MSKFWFRKNHASSSPARLAETQNLLARQEAYDRAKDATVHLLIALKQWPGFDSTGSIGGAIDHTLVNIERLDDALDDLRDHVDQFRLASKAQAAQQTVPVSSGNITVTVGGSTQVTPKSVADQVEKRIHEAFRQAEISKPGIRI